MEKEIKIRPARPIDAVNTMLSFRTLGYNPSLAGLFCQVLIMLSCIPGFWKFTYLIWPRISYQLHVVEIGGKYAGFGYLQGGSWRDRIGVARCLKPECRGKGIGYKLLDLQIEEAKKRCVDYLTDTAALDNPANWKSVEKRGFKPFRTMYALDLRE